MKPRFPISMTLMTLPRISIAASRCTLLAAAIPFVFGTASPGFTADGDEALAVATLERTSPVDFERELLPIFRRSCIACHSESKARGGLVLESPETIRKGSDSGPVVEPGKGEASFLFLAASHREDPFMPPADNKAGAKNLKPEELALIRLWIDQGATGTANQDEKAIDWHRLPANLGPIYAADVSEDGRFAACGRGGRIFVYALAGDRSPWSPVDPALLDLGIYPAPGVAHLDEVQAVKLARDGSWFVSAGYRVVKLWRRGLVSIAASGGGGDDGGVAAYAFSPDRHRFALGGKDGSIRILAQGDSTAAPLSIRADEGETVALVWSASGQSLLSASRDGSVRAWSAETGALEGAIELGRAIRTMRPDSEHGVVIEPDEGPSIRWWGTGFESVAQAPGPESPPEAPPTVEREADGTLRVAQGDESFAVGIPTDVELEAAVLDPSRARVALRGGSRLYVSPRAQGAAAFELAGDPELEGERARAERRFALFTGRRDAARGRRDEAKKKLDESDGAVKKAAEAVEAAEKADSEAEEAAKAAAEDKEKGKALEKAKEELENARRTLEDAKLDHERARVELERREADLALHEEDLARATAERDAALAAFEGLGSPITATAFSPDGEILAAGREKNGVLEIWDATSGVLIDSKVFGDRRIEAIAWEDDLLFVRDASDRVDVFRVARDYELSRTLGAPTGAGESPFADRVLALDISPDGTLVATGGGDPSRSGEIVVFRISDGAVVFESREHHSDTVFAVRFSPCGRYLATAGADRMARIFRLADGEVIGVYEGHSSHVIDIAWQPDGRTIATCGADNVIKIWDVETREVGRTIGGFGKEVSGIEFTGEGDLVASISGDHNLRIHHAGNGQQVRAAGLGSDFLYTVAVTGDGKELVAGGYDGVLRLIDTEKCQVVRELHPGE